LRALLRHRWPGNVRELENTVERAVVLCNGKSIELSDLPWSPGEASPPASDASRGPQSLAEAVERCLEGRLDPPPRPGKVWDDVVQTVEAALLKWALSQTDGVRLRAAEVLGIHRNTLRKKLGERG